ncbi:transcriptional regulator [Rhodanobacter koreensis]
MLATQFNTRFRGPSVTFQTAWRWLNGQAIPQPDKLTVLADWLRVDRGLLGFGEMEPHRGAGKHVKESTASYDADELVDAIHALPAAHRQLVRDLVAALAGTPSRKRSA